MEFTYKKYSPEYKEQVIDLLDNLWDFSRETKLAYFKWKFEDNPYTDDVAGFIALDGDTVVAFRGYMVEPMRIGDTVFLNAQLADTVTHPGYRRMGLFKSITQFSVEELNKDKRFGVSLNSSSGGPTIGGYLQVGWKPLSEREHLFRFSMKGIINKLMGKNAKFIPSSSSDKSFRIDITMECRPDEIASIPYDYNRISHEHSPSFYKWRLENPRNKFVFAYFYEDNTLKAFIAFVDMGGARYDIIDFNCTNPYFLKRLLNKFCKTQQPLYVSLWTVGKNNCMFCMNKSFGLYTIRFVLKHFKNFRKPPFLAREFNGAGNIDIHNPDSWDLYKITADEI